MTYIPHRKHTAFPYKYHLFNAVEEMVAIYCENHTKYINTACVGKIQIF